MYSIPNSPISQSARCSASMAPAYIRGIPREVYRTRYSQQPAITFTWQLPELPTVNAAA